MILDWRPEDVEQWVMKEFPLTALRILPAFRGKEIHGSTLWNLDDVELAAMLAEPSDVDDILGALQRIKRHSDNESMLECLRVMEEDFLQSGMEENSCLQEEFNTELDRIRSEINDSEYCNKMCNAEKSAFDQVLVDKGLSIRLDAEQRLLPQTLKLVDKLEQERLDAEFARIISGMRDAAAASLTGSTVEPSKIDDLEGIADHDGALLGEMLREVDAKDGPENKAPPHIADDRGHDFKSDTVFSCNPPSVVGFSEQKAPVFSKELVPADPEPFSLPRNNSHVSEKSRVGGVGMKIKLEEVRDKPGQSLARVCQILEGGSAKANGWVHVDDFLLEVDERKLTFLSMDKIRGLIVGPVNTPVTLCMRRPGGENYSVTLLRQSAQATEEQRIKDAVDSWSDSAILHCHSFDILPQADITSPDKDGAKDPENDVFADVQNPASSALKLKDPTHLQHDVPLPRDKERAELDSDDEAGAPEPRTDLSAGTCDHDFKPTVPPVFAPPSGAAASQKSPKDTVSDAKDILAKGKCASCLSNRQVARLSCEHSMCKSCMTTLFQKALSDISLLPVRCCQKPVSMELAFLFLKPDEYLGLVQRITESETPNYMYCQNPRCSAFIAIDKMMLSANKSGYFECTKCMSPVCIHCKKPWHAGLSCEQHKEAAEEDALSGVAKEHGWMKCGKCSVFVSLKHGCNHMTCLCGHNFCYACGHVWHTCTCSLWSEPMLLAEEDRRVEVNVARQQQDLQRVLRPAEVAQVRYRVRERLHYEDRNYEECQHKNRTAAIDGNFGHCFSCGWILDLYGHQCHYCDEYFCSMCHRHRL